MEMNWHTDKNGNFASVEFFGSKELAQAALRSLTNCFECTNCMHCSNCEGCTDCAYESRLTNHKGVVRSWIEYPSALSEYVREAK